MLLLFFTCHLWPLTSDHPVVRGANQTAETGEIYTLAWMLTDSALPF